MQRNLANINNACQGHAERAEIIPLSYFILQADKFLKYDWLRPVVFKPNLKYLHVKITPIK